MRIVYQYITSEGSSSIVVYATGSIGDVAHDECLGPWAETGEDIGDGGGKEQQAFWKLESYLFGSRCTYTMDCLVYLECIVGW